MRQSDFIFNGFLKPVAPLMLVVGTIIIIWLSLMQAIKSNKNGEVNKSRINMAINHLIRPE